MKKVHVGDKVTWPNADEGEFDIVLHIEDEHLGDEAVIKFSDGTWLSVRQAIPFAQTQESADYFSDLVEKAYERAYKAISRYPQPNYVLAKVAEEGGEVIKSVIHYHEGRETWENVENEIIDNLAMLIRLLKEGDQTIGFSPPNFVIDEMR